MRVGPSGGTRWSRTAESAQPRAFARDACTSIQADSRQRHRVSKTASSRSTVST
jgi:hypothetical protein